MGRGIYPTPEGVEGRCESCRGVWPEAELDAFRAHQCETVRQALLRHLDWRWDESDRERVSVEAKAEKLFSGISSGFYVEEDCVLCGAPALRNGCCPRCLDWWQGDEDS